MNYMDIAIRASQSSNCKRKKTGAVVVLADGGWVVGCNIINNPGVCNNCPREGLSGGNWLVGDCGVVHAEINAIKKAVAGGKDLRNANIYCTYKPCLDCAVGVFKSGIRKVVYMDDYPGMNDVEDYLKQNNIELVRWDV